ncbi:hypothetical protein [Rhizobium sp. 2MFCol3.1]|uniref:hypothetical protein n=1 Tax=Rhizobium sp. 2MFCol3.1 TaxID=1246459 RepID=UPI000371D7B6|nr:hypothetical protein [Rhizobium sp. 2MFCol3.1]
MTIAYTTGQITLTNGSAVVTGIGTAWQVSLIAGGFIAAEADGNPLPIATVDSDTSITAAIEWMGASGTYDYALVRDTAYLQQLNVNSNTLARLIAELDAGTIFKYDASGDLAGRATYDARAKGFSYLVFIGVTVPVLYVKASATSGDWSGPFAYGTGPVGPMGPAGYVNPRGVYSAATAYSRNDGVLYNGSSFVALQPTTGNAPPTLPTISNAYWQLTALKGTDGTGTGDVVGPAGVVDGLVAAFDGVTGKLIKALTSAELKAFIGPTEGRNDALLAIEIADLKGQRMGMIGGVADAFDDVSGILAGSSANYVYDAANDWFSPANDISAAAAPNTTAPISNITVFNRDVAISNGRTVLGLLLNSSVAGSYSLKIAQRTAAGAYNIVYNQVVSHPGGAVLYSLTTPYTVPASGTFYMGASSPLSNPQFIALSSRAYKTGDLTGAQTGFTEDANVQTFSIGAVYGLLNMTLVSVNYPTPSAPSIARVAVQLADALTLAPNTDFTMEVTRDGGTTWTAVTLALTMPSLGGVKMYEGTVSLVAQPSGTAIGWRFKTLTNKNIIASGVVLQQS